MMELKPKKQISDACVTLVKTFEGFEAKAYKCPAGVWTIGYGHTLNVKPTDVITEVAASMLLKEELQNYADKVDKIVAVASQNQFDALVSFAYNVGTSALSGSTLLKKHNAGEYLEAQEQFLKWDRAAGKVLAGLTRRRAHEAALYGK
jgi:lysozyme